MDIDLKDVCYHVHHLPKSGLARSITFARINKILKGHVDKISSSSVGIRNKKELTAFQKHYPLFKIEDTPDYQHKFRYPELGLWAGSYVLFKNFLETNYKYLIVLEDDIILSKDFVSLFKFYSKQLPCDWDCFFLFQTRPTVRGGYRALPDIYRTDSEDIWHAHHGWSTAGMLINRDAAIKLVKHIELQGIRLPLDQLILETNGDVPDPKATYRLLRSYSLARHSKKMSRVFRFRTQIQNGSFIDV